MAVRRPPPTPPAPRELQMETWTKEKVCRFQLHKRVKPKLCVSKRWGHHGLTSPYWPSAVGAGNNPQALTVLPIDAAAQKYPCAGEANSQMETSKGDFCWDAVPPTPSLLSRETEPTWNEEQGNPHGRGQQERIHLKTENTELFVFKSSQNPNFSPTC